MSWAQKPRVNEGGDVDGAGAANDNAGAQEQQRSRVLHLMQRARAYHARHADWVKEFNDLTGGVCADESGGIDYRKMRHWQAAHHLKVDGLVGPSSLKAAHAQGGAPDKPKETPPAQPPQQQVKAEPKPEPKVESKPEPTVDKPDPEADAIAAAASDVQQHIDEHVETTPPPPPPLQQPPQQQGQGQVKDAEQTPPPGAHQDPVVPTNGVREASKNEVNSSRGSVKEFAHAESGYRKTYKVGKFDVLTFLPAQGIVPPSVDVYLFYHGMYTDFSTEKTNGFHAGEDNPAKGVDMAGSVTASARNVIAIMPMAPNGAGANWEALAGSHKKIVDAVLTNLGNDLGLAGPLAAAHISVAGHSRGGVALGDAASEMMDAVTDVTLQDAGYGGSSFEGSFEKVRDWLLLGKGPKTLRLITQDVAGRKERNTETNKHGLNEGSFTSRIEELKKQKKLKDDLTVTAHHSGKEPKHFEGAWLESQIDIVGPGGKQGSVYVLREQTGHFGVRNQSTKENLKTGPDGIGWGITPMGGEEPQKPAPVEDHHDEPQPPVKNEAHHEEKKPVVPEPTPKPEHHDTPKKEKPHKDEHKAETKGKGEKRDALGNLSERVDPSTYKQEQTDRVFTNSFTVVSPKALIYDANGKKTGEFLPVGTEVLVYKANHMLVQVATADAHASPAVQQADNKWMKFASLGGKGAETELGNENSDADDKARADQLRAGLPPGRQPGKSSFKWGFGGGFEPELDGIALASGLMAKVHQLMEWAIANDMVTGDIEISSGMRSPSKAHKLGTSYEIQNMDSRGNVTLESLKALPGGKDEDGNTWYKPGWESDEIKANAKKYKSGTAVAAGGYPKGDKRRLPIVGPQPGVSRHCTGHAVDVKIPWRDPSGKGTDVWAWENIYHQFGLTRPLHKNLVSGTLQEYWHIEETGKHIVGADANTDDVADK